VVSDRLNRSLLLVAIRSTHAAGKPPWDAAETRLPGIANLHTPPDLQKAPRALMSVPRDGHRPETQITARACGQGSTGGDGAARKCRQDLRRALPEDTLNVETSGSRMTVSALALQPADAPAADHPRIGQGQDQCRRCRCRSAICAAF
jgi:hypothetical protein